MKKKMLAVIMVLAISLCSLSVFAVVNDNAYTPEQNGIYQEMIATRGPGGGGYPPPPNGYPD